MPVVIESLEQEEITIQVQAGDNLVVHLKGVMREENTGADAWLSTALRRAYDLASDWQEITLDIREVSYMNATAFRVFIPWIRKLANRTPPCKLRIKHDPNRMWQAVSVTSFKAIVADMIIADT